MYPVEQAGTPRPTQATQVVYICIWKDKDLNTNTELKKTKGLEFHVLGNKMNQDPFEFTARFLNQGGYLVPHQKLEDVQALSVLCLRYHRLLFTLCLVRGHP